MSGRDVGAFGKEVAFSEKCHSVKVDRKIIIMPMLGLRAPERVNARGMKVYTAG